MDKSWWRFKYEGVTDLFKSRDGRLELSKYTQQFCSIPLALLCFFTPFISRETAIAVTIVLIVIVFTISFISSICFLAPRGFIQVNYPDLDTSVKIREGDLFKEKDADLVIGFSDCFDTDISDGTIIAPKSVQGQFTKRFYDDNGEKLSIDLERSLEEMRVSGNAEYITDNNKAFGNKFRYKLPITPHIQVDDRNVYCAAYSRMGEDKRTRSDLDTFWLCLNDLWKTIDGVSRDSIVAMSVLGTDRARLGICLNDQTALQLILSSYHANAELGSRCEELIIVIHPTKRKKYNLVSLRAFLRSLD